MIKRILIALDPDPDTPVATRYAIDIALRHHAEVTGLAIIDSRHIAAEVGGGGIGTMYYSEMMRAQQTERSRETARALTDAFEQALAEAGVRYGERVEDGMPYQRIVEHTRYHDLLVLGQKSHFAYDSPQELTRTVSRVVKHGIIPTLLVGQIHRPISRVLLSYDGSMAAARTMQRFAQLRPFGKKLRMEVVHVRTSDSEHGQHESELLLRLAAGFLRAHGFSHTEETSLEWGEAGPRLLAHASNTGADLIVAGAHSVSAMRRIAFGSTTHTLLESGHVPVFLFH